MNTGTRTQQWCLLLPYPYPWELSSVLCWVVALSRWERLWRWLLLKLSKEGILLQGKQDPLKHYLSKHLILQNKFLFASLICISYFAKQTIFCPIYSDFTKFWLRPLEILKVLEGWKRYLRNCFWCPLSLSSALHHSCPLLEQNELQNHAGPTSDKPLNVLQP